MKTKLEQITTAAELITFITAFGTPTDLESICRMQDIIGHTGQDELIRLAQDNGTETDGTHTWSTGRRGTQKETLSLLYTIWNWEDATRFYNNHVNPEYRKAKEEAKKARQEAEEAKAEAEKARKNSEEWKEAATKIKANWRDSATDAEAQKARADAAEAENLKLKAMLFDYMTKTA